jgi:hypothetical protein
VVAVGQALPADGENVQLLVGYYGHEGATKQCVDLHVRLKGLSTVLKNTSPRSEFAGSRMPAQPSWQACTSLPSKPFASSMMRSTSTSTSRSCRSTKALAITLDET